MPRPKVIERRRCVKACESCKKRKEKCDGLKPCANCKKRNIEDTCSYSTRAPVTTFKTHKSIPFEVHEEVIGNTNQLSAMDIPQDVSKDINGSDELVESNMAACATSAPVPQLSRLLRDPKGKFSMNPHSAIRHALTKLSSIPRGLGVLVFSSDHQACC
jgi:hypothetical protein